MSGYAVVAMALFIVWVLLAGVGRILLQRHRTGDSGFRFAVAPRWSLQWWANRIAGAGGVSVGLGAPLAGLLGLPVAPALDVGGLQAGGVILTAGGIILTCWSQLAMGASWRIGVDPSERTALITSGPFTVVRNPIFTAAGLTFIGLTLTVPNAVSLIGLAGFIVGVQMQVRGIEEPYLRSVHSERYEQYAAHVGRFVPGLGKLRPPH